MAELHTDAENQCAVKCFAAWVNARAVQSLRRQRASLVGQKWQTEQGFPRSWGQKSSAWHVGTTQWSSAFYLAARSLSNTARKLLANN